MLPVFRRLVLSAVIAGLAGPSVPLFAAPGTAGQPATGTVSGTAHTPSGQAIPNITVRLRNIQTGQLAGATTSGAEGQFIFTGLGPGNYAVEVVNAAGEVVGTSALISLTPPAMVAANLVVTLSAASARAAAAGGSFFTSTWGIVTVAALGAGVVGVTVAANSEIASPSR